MPDEPDDDLLLDFIDTSHAVLIADIISSWARFEYEIDELNWELARLEQGHGACLTAQFPTVASRFDAALALCRLESIDQKKINRMNSLKEKTLAIAQHRNRIVHDPFSYGYRSKKHYRLQKTAKSRLDYCYKSVTESELQQILDGIKAISEQFNFLRSEILNEFWSLPKTYQEVTE